MNSPHDPAENRTNRQWDEAAIVSAYEDLLDEIGRLQDLARLSGCRRFFPEAEPLHLYWRLLQQTEEELLIQWKIYRERGLAALFDRQRGWLNQSLRADDGWFETWNVFCIRLRQRLSDPALKVHPDPWKAFILYTISHKDAITGLEGLDPTEATDPLLTMLFRLFAQLGKIDPYHQCLCFLNLLELGVGYRPALNPLGQTGTADLPNQRDFSTLRALLSQTVEKDRWNELPERLQAFWKNHSGGDCSLYPAFLVQRRSDGRPVLKGVWPERWIHFTDLVGIEFNQHRLQANIDRFLAGRPAHHVLLWGGRGTGKSSSVLALLDAYVEAGLRLVEIQQSDLDLIPALSRMLGRRRERFLLFCDDLSFDGAATEYRYLKSIMEGSVLTPATNLLFIATANRKDLVVRGAVDERDPEQKQLIDEKRAIDDRFGLKLFFEVPVFQQLEAILFHYADRTGVPYEREGLLREFRRFALRNQHDQPAGRTVHQFMLEWRETRERESKRKPG
jgi:predicted AAA+ superfamily ATPase